MQTFFETDVACPKCEAPIRVYPAYKTVARITQRSLPAWTRCECPGSKKWEEITTALFDELVPGWRELIDPGDPTEILEA